MDDYFRFPQKRRRRKEQNQGVPALEAILVSMGFRIEQLEDRFQEVRYADDGPSDPDERIEFCVRAVKVSCKVRRDSPLVMQRY